MKLLVISYYWPPCGGPGALRPVKFAKYLPRFGIEPIIVTRKNIAYHSIDNELESDVRHVRVMRTESLDPARILYYFGMRTYTAQTWHTGIKHALNLPDNKLPWSPFAFAAATRVDFDYIFVTAPPFSSFIAGYYLARKTNKPLILDFRDAWLEFPFLPYKGTVQKSFVAYWEEKIVGQAALVISVDENIKEALLQKYPHLLDKTFVIPNGYDPDDFTTPQKPKIFTISYLGTIREERNPDNVLTAVQELITEQIIPENEVKLKFIGSIQEPYASRIKNYQFATMYGHLPYRTAIKEFAASHVALIITTGSTYFVPSRQNEYLASGLPIIVCGRSQGIHLLEQAFNRGYPGYIYDFNDQEGMKKKIAGLYTQFKRGETIQGKTPYQEYTRENLTKKLAALIRKIE